MDEHLFSALKGRAARLDARAAHPRWCEISDVDPDNHLLRVIMRPGDALSGWMPYGAIAVGSVKISIPPTPGDQAHVIFPHGDSQQGIVAGVTYSTKNPPAVSPFTGKAPQVGEALVTGMNGAALHLTQDGNWTIQGNVKIVGALLVTEDITSQQDVLDEHGSLDRLRRNYNAHRDVDSHGDRAGLNDHQDPE